LRGYRGDVKAHKLAGFGSLYAFKKWRSALLVWRRGLVL